jgi:predicted ATPase with chaperone activity
MARTIADLASSDGVSKDHILEALVFRDRSTLTSLKLA